MDWWQHILVYIGVYLLAFTTGYHAGVAGIVKKLAKTPLQTLGKSSPRELAEMMALRGHGQGVKQ